MTVKVTIKNARLFFPRLFQAEQYQGQGPFNYSGKFGVEPTSETHKSILAAIEEEGQRVFEKKWPNMKAQFQGDKKAFPYFDGSGPLVDFEGAEGYWVLTGKRKQDAGPVLVLDRDKTKLKESDGVIYSGCYVNATVEIWGQNSAKGKGMRCTIRGVQFLRDGDSYAGGGKASEEEFEDLSADDADFSDEDNLAD